MKNYLSWFDTGGALITGEGAAYPGVELTKKGVVLVTINYRLGLLGIWRTKN